MPSNEELAAARAAHPDENGPAFTIDPTDFEVILRLTELKERVARESPRFTGYEPPEVVFSRVSAQLPLLVDTLLADGTARLWTVFRSAPGYPNIGEGFNEACDLIHAVEGVIFTPPKPS